MIVVSPILEGLGSESLILLETSTDILKVWCTSSSDLRASKGPESRRVT
jgi:hypothetical protein